MDERRKPYPFDQFEPKWQAIWEEQQLFHASNPGEKGFEHAKPKFYVLDMFPYPSGAGLHVGTPKGILPRISSRVTSGCADSMCCIRWDGTHLVSLRSNT